LETEEDYEIDHDGALATLGKLKPNEELPQKNQPMQTKKDFL